jgi:hypothetical protein
MLDTIRTTDINSPDNARDLTLAESSAWLKQELKRRFPATKFSVRMSSGTGYGMAHVKWTDGPTTTRVDEVLAICEGEGFDGMTDCATFKKTRTVFDPKRGEWVRPRLRLINTHRKLSEACELMIARAIGKRYHADVPARDLWDRTSPFGEACTYDNSWRRLIWRASSDRTTLGGI